MKKLIVILLMLTAMSVNAQWLNMNSPVSRINGITSINNNIFITSMGYGILTSGNGGVNWTSVNNGLPTLYTYCITASANNLFVSSTGNTPEVYLSTNLGANWTLANSGLSSGLNSLFASASYVYAGNSSGAYYSTNNGANWILSNLTGVTPMSFVKSGSVLFAGTFGNGVYKSTDNGFNWINCSSGLTTLNINTLGVLGTDIFAGTNYGGAMYKTTNNGASWTEANSGIMHLVIRSIASQGGHIFATANDSYGCIYHSTNAGQNWITKNQGFGYTVPNFTYLYITNDYVYAGTYSSNIWKRSYQDLIGIQKISEVVPSSYSLSQNYPNPFNPSTVIRCQLPVVSNVSLKVYDVMGREVQTLVSEKLQAGSYEVKFDAGMSGLTSGVYFYKMGTEGYSETKRMLLIK
ncbi:MAG: T9SS type A sorting domain-containing protein [Ignavibacteriota bacterium]